MAIPQSVVEKVRRFDSALRLIEKRHYDPEKRDKECMMICLQRRDRAGNYQTIGWVRPDLLGDGSMLLNKLSRNDVRNYGSGTKAADAYDEAERQEKAKRKADRIDHFEQIGKETYKHMQRRGGERINNAGMPNQGN